MLWLAQTPSHSRNRTSLSIGAHTQRTTLALREGERITSAERSDMDKILIKDLLTRCIIGVGDEERKDKQDVVINIVLWADLSSAGSSDRLEDSVDYSRIKKEVIAMVEASEYHLVEALAERIAGICLGHRLVQQVQVTVEKPSALRFARSVGVEIVRGQGDR